MQLAITCFYFKLNCIAISNFEYFSYQYKMTQVYLFENANVEQHESIYGASQSIVIYLYYGTQIVLEPCPKCKNYIIFSFFSPCFLYPSAHRRDH